MCSVNRKHVIIFYFLQIQAKQFLCSFKNGLYRYSIRKSMETYFEFPIRNWVQNWSLTLIFFRSLIVKKTTFEIKVCFPNCVYELLYSRLQFRCQNIHLVPKSFDKYRAYRSAGAFLAPCILYRIAEKPPPSSAK